jgi:nucleoside 2-deoxyribosyltransferase
MRRKLKIYLAGPDVFLSDAIEVGRRKKELCAEHGFEGLYPFDNEIVPDRSGGRIDLRIYRANLAMIGDADLGIANLTPFRGPSADVGTVFELGVLIALHKPAFGYTNDRADLLDRVKRAGIARYDQSAGVWRDQEGMTIENFGNADNLMIDAALAEQGHPIIRHDASPEDRFHDLAAFEECLRLAAEQLQGSTIETGPARAR